MTSTLPKAWPSAAQIRLPVTYVIDRRPFYKTLKLAFFQLHEFGPDGEARLDIEKQRGLVLKVDGKGVVIAGGEELDALGGFPFI